MSAIKNLLIQLQSIAMKSLVRTGVLMIVPILELISFAISKSLSETERKKLIKELKEGITIRLQVE